MIRFVVCGEGSSDLMGEESPLTVAVKKLIDFWFSENVEMNFVSRSELSDDVKNEKPKRGASVRGQKNPFPEMRSVTRFAKCLAKRAVSQGEDCGAIYFKDTDFSSNLNRDEFYLNLNLAMHRGFDEIGFQKGVPMIPKTRSESWMLCIVDASGAMRESYYEMLPGSDNSPRSGKKLLAKKLKCSEKQNYVNLGKYLDSYDWDKLPAPSFVFFKNRLHVVAASILRKPFPSGMNLDNTKTP